MTTYGSHGRGYCRIHTSEDNHGQRDYYHCGQKAHRRGLCARHYAQERLTEINRAISVLKPRLDYVYRRLALDVLNDRVPDLESYRKELQELDNSLVKQERLREYYQKKYRQSPKGDVF